jgi:hypothetical protein
LVQDLQTPSESAPEGPSTADAQPEKKKRGRPPGSKNQTKAPAKKAAKKTEAKGKAKPATVAEKKTKELVRVRSSQLRKGAAAGDTTAQAALEMIQKAYAKVGKAKGRKADVSRASGERLKASEAAFVNAIESPLQVGVVETKAYQNKLEAVELRWQEWAETKSGNIEERKNATQRLKEAQQALAEAIENSEQLPLPGV